MAQKIINNKSQGETGLSSRTKINSNFSELYGVIDINGGENTGDQDITGKEDKSNKVSSFQSVPDNTHYTGEKLVKDSLDNKADLISGKVPSIQLPSYVDDVIEYADFASLPVTGESGKIYVTLDDNLTYRWSGTIYVNISISLTLGETSSSAYRGDRGKIAYDHSQLTHAPANAQPNSDITPGEIAAKLPTNILLNDGSTPMVGNTIYTEILPSYTFNSHDEISVFFSNNNNADNFNVGDWIKIFSTNHNRVYYKQVSQIDSVSYPFAFSNIYWSTPDYALKVDNLNKVVKVSRTEVLYTPTVPKDIATKEYVDSKSINYTNSSPIQQALGGIAVGETFENISVVDMFDKLLYPYQSPVFSTFSLSNGRTILECGENWNGVTNALFTFTNVFNIKADSLAIYQDATTLVSAQHITSPISVTLMQANKSVDAQYINMKIESENTNNILFNRSFNVTWYMPYYFGVGNTGLDVTAIQILTKTITSKANISKTYNTNNQVPYLAYPTSRGLLTSILDKNGYETISDFTRTTRMFIINGISVQYYVYEFNNPSTANNLQISYKY